MTTAHPSTLIFLPGASDNTDFWRPAARQLAHPAHQLHVGWPGFGPTPADPQVNSLDDLVTRLLPTIDQPTALVAQSMGGIVAVRAALARPEWITHLVLSVTSGGVNMPVLLLWGDSDPISPVAVGEHLAGLLPRATLYVLTGAGHDLGSSHAPEVAQLIDRHLA